MAAINLSISKAAIRRGRLGDARALALFAEHAFRDTFAAWNSAADMERHCSASFGTDIQSRELNDPGCVTLVAEKGGELVGFAQLRLESPQECVSAERPAELYRLYVARQWHGCGLARELMHEALDTAARAAADCLWLGVWEHNARAISFYRKVGFRVVGDHVFMLGSDSQRDLVMRLVIESTLRHGRAPND